MNYQFQPSAVGLASQALNDFIKNRAKIDVALSDLSTTVNDAQLKMGLAASDSAFASGVAESESTKNAAIGSMIGAGLSMASSAIALKGQHSNYKKANMAVPAQSQVGIQQGQPANAAGANPVAPAVAPNANGVGAGAVVGQNAPAAPVQPQAANNAGGNQGGDNNNQGAGNQNLSPAQAEANQWQGYWATFGRDYPSSFLKIGESGGGMVAAGDKLDKAAADRDQTLEQTIKQMMEAQSSLITGAMRSNDEGTTNTISIIQALIAANRAG